MRRTFGAIALACLAALPAHAQGAFDGKTLTYIIATSPGGGYDTYARVIGKYLGDKLGASKVLFQNLPGAGHIVGATTLYRSEPDGLTIGTFNTGLIYAQILGQEGIDFDLAEFAWVGKAASDPRVIVLSSESGLADLQALLDTEERVNFAASGVGSASYNETKMLIDGLDLNVELIPGFNGNEGEMAMLRGEVAGQVGSQSSLQPFVDAGHGFFAAGIGGDVEPQVVEAATSDKGLAIVKLIDALSNLGRLTAAPPGTDAAVLEKLRDGYMAVMEDPDFLAEAEQLGIPIDPARGDRVAQMVSEALNQSPETVAIITSALGTAAPVESVSSKILSLEDRNKIVGFTGASGAMTGEVSGSRTTLTINGQPAERDALAVGMDCTLEYEPADAIEFSKLDCTGDAAAAAAPAGTTEAPAGDTAAAAPAAETPAMAGMTEVEGEITALGDENRMVTLKTEAGDVTMRVSGSRTALQIGGSEAEREALAVGMTCDVTYDQANPDMEMATLTCN